VWLDCWHFAVDAHVSQTAVETITGGLKRQMSHQSYKKKAMLSQGDRDMLL